MHVVIAPDEGHDNPSEIAGIETEYFEQSGNLHITDDNVIQVAETVDGRVLIEYVDHGKEWIDNASIVTVHNE